MTNKLYLRIMGDCFSPNVFREIAALTNFASADINNVNFDSDNKTLSIPIERHHIESYRRFLGPKYDHKKRIPSLIKLGAVRRYEIEDHCRENDLTKIQLLFGLSVKIDEKEIYLGSVEEDQGWTCFSITAIVEQFDIEISDI